MKELQSFTKGDLVIKDEQYVTIINMSEEPIIFSVTGPARSSIKDLDSLDNETLTEDNDATGKDDREDKLDLETLTEESDPTAKDVREMSDSKQSSLIKDPNDSFLMYLASTLLLYFGVPIIFLLLILVGSSCCNRVSRRCKKGKAADA